jgi:segregation and condensation protein B
MSDEKQDSPEETSEEIREESSEESHEDTENAGALNTAGTEEVLEASAENEVHATPEPGLEGAAGDDAALDIALVKQVLETALLTSPEPLTLNDMKRMFPRGTTNNELVRKLLQELAADWQGRGVELVNVASGWRFRAKPELQRFLDKLNPQKAPKYSRAVMETLAIIAYRQPVTRGDIEDIRGVVVSSNIMKALETRGWIDVIGHREVPGRPAIFATTKQFLDDLSLRSLEELPPLDDLGALVDASGAAQVELNMPSPGGASISAGEGMIEANEDDETTQHPDIDRLSNEDETPPPSQLH